jgi:transcriptional regulator with XRE-family HTH domain
VITIRREELDIARRAAGLHKTTADLARAMGMTSSAVGRTLANNRAVSAEFIAGMTRAFPNLGFHHLFEVTDDEEAIPA